MKNRLRRFVKLWIDLFHRHELLDHASAIAFQVLKSLIPLTLLGLAILGATGQEHVWRETIAPAMKPHLQLPTFRAIDYGVEKIFTTNSAGLIVFASFLSLWYISGAVRAVIGGMNQIYETEDERRWPVRYAISFGLAACIAVGVIGAALSCLVCLTPLAAVALGAIGLGAWSGHLDALLLPSLVLFIAVAVYRSRAACRRAS